VTLMGSGFTGATDVPFGSVDITTTPCGSGPCFDIVGDTQITVQGVPAAGPGPVSVSVNTPGGPTGTLTYTYVTGPTLTSLSPPSGPTAGGNSVILTGTGFTGATDVNFGSNDLNPCVSGECFTVNSDTKITVSGVLASSAGGVPVNVVTPGGTTAPNLTYTYVTGPTLTSLSPPSGPTAGGNSVILTGTGFTGATTVNFGPNPLSLCGSGSCFSIDSDTQITVNSAPAGGAGGVLVAVVTPGGTSGNQTYTYLPPTPTVTKVTPNAGGPLGGNTVVLTGTDFEAAGTPIVTAVTVGSNSVTTTPCPATPTSACFTVNSATGITIQVLPAGTGMVNVTVTTSGGVSAVSPPSTTYTYVSSFPAVSLVSPKFGAAGGGAYVTIIGANFGDPSQGFGATDVLFGSTDVPVSNAFPCAGSASGCFVQIGATTLDVYTPAVAAGTVDITVQTPGGNSQAALADRYTFVAAGAYTALSPFRICDTRKAGPGIAANQCDTGPGRGTLGPGWAITAQITGGAVPANAQAVVVNLTAINHGFGPTYVSAYPAGAQTLTSNINLAGRTVEANLAIVRLSAAGQISVFNAAGTADVIVDVEGYFAAAGGGSAGAFHSIPPLRICDSRGGVGNTTICATATGRSSAPLVGGVWRHVTLSGLPPGAPPTTPYIPTNGTAAAAVFNLTATAGSLPTYLSVAVPTGSDACPSSAPSFSNLNPTPGISLPNRVISNLGPNQDICLYSALGSINFIIDVNGWFGTGSAPAGAFFYSVPPTRICDTRPSFGTRCQNRALGTNPTGELIQVAGIVAVPASLPHALADLPVATAVVANLTAVAGTAATYFTLYPSDASKPTASDLNPSAGEVIANLAITGLGQTGATTVGNVNLYNPVGTINALLDVAGWFQ